MKAYKKFGAPLKRLEAVACDAELQEKPLAELRKLGETLRERCAAAMIELQGPKENDPAATLAKNEGGNEDSNLSGESDTRAASIMIQGYNGSGQ